MQLTDEQSKRGRVGGHERVVDTEGAEDRAGPTQDQDCVVERQSIDPLEVRQESEHDTSDGVRYPDDGDEEGAVLLRDVHEGGTVREEHVRDTQSDAGQQVGNGEQHEAEIADQTAVHQIPDHISNPPGKSEFLQTEAILRFQVVLDRVLFLVSALERHRALSEQSRIRDVDRYAVKTQADGQLLSGSEVSSIQRCRAPQRSLLVDVRPTSVCHGSELAHPPFGHVIFQERLLK